MPHLPNIFVLHTLCSSIKQRYAIPELRDAFAAAGVSVPAPAFSFPVAPSTTSPTTTTTVDSSTGNPPGGAPTTKRRKTKSTPAALPPAQPTSLLSPTHLHLCAGKFSIGEWKAAHGHVVESLLARGGDVEYTDADGHFPLLMAVQYSLSLPVVKQLVAAGADPTRAAPAAAEFRAYREKKKAHASLSRFLF